LLVILENFDGWERGAGDRYQFFRALAQKRRNSLPPPRRDHSAEMLAHLLRASLDADPELAHYNIAMIDAYFSRLEHLFGHRPCVQRFQSRC
jgi:hypothetical protein